MLCGNDMASRSNQTVITNKNIGIIHNREFEDGVLKIEFYTDAALEQAKVLLTKRNYKICER